MSVEHLETRTTETTTNLYFQHFPEGLDGEAIVASVGAAARVEEVGGQAVNASVERISDQHGSGLTVSWDLGLPAGWYRIVVPRSELPTFVNHRAWSEEAEEAAVWFRVGSQPLVRSIVRLSQGSRTFFEIHFSEPVRAETAQIADLVQLYDNDKQLICGAVQSIGATESADLTRLFRSFVLSCEGETLSATRVEVGRFKTPEGEPVQTVDGTGILYVDWSEAAVLEGGLSEQWFETQLPSL